MNIESGTRDVAATSLGLRNLGPPDLRTSGLSDLCTFGRF